MQIEVVGQPYEVQGIVYVRAVINGEKRNLRQSTVNLLQRLAHTGLTDADINDICDLVSECEEDYANAREVGM